MTKCSVCGCPKWASVHVDSASLYDHLFTPANDTYAASCPECHKKSPWNCHNPWHKRQFTQNGSVLELLKRPSTDELLAERTQYFMERAEYGDEAGVAVKELATWALECACEVKLLRSKNQTLVRLLSDCPVHLTGDLGAELLASNIRTELGRRK